MRLPNGKVVYIILCSHGFYWGIEWNMDNEPKQLWNTYEFISADGTNFFGELFFPFILLIVGIACRIFGWLWPNFGHTYVLYLNIFIWPLRQFTLPVLTLSACDYSLFFKQEMELSLIGLQNAGKTSLVNVVAVSKSAQWLWMGVSFLSVYLFGWCVENCIFYFQTGGYSEDMIPTVSYLYKWVIIATIFSYKQYS